MKQQTTRRESFLERRSSATVRARRYPVPGEPSSETRLQAHRAREIDQPQSLALPRPRRVRLPCGDAPAGLHHRGICKNTVRVLAMFALANLYLVRRRLLPPGNIRPVTS